MELRRVTLDLLGQVETATGLPVQVTALPSLDVLAVVRPARGSQAVHHVLYNPLAEQAPDYLIGHGCGLILRLFASPAAQRVELAPADAGRAMVAEMLRSPHGVAQRFRLGEEQVVTLRDKLYGGLMLQLRTTATGLRVDRWLRDRCAALADLQDLAAREQLAEGLELLRPEPRAMTPPLPLTASLAMNAAVAAFWAGTWDEPDLLAPYRPAGGDRDGEALLRVWRAIPDDPRQDRRLVDAWAAMLQLVGWYEWRPYPSPD